MSRYKIIIRPNGNPVYVNGIFLGLDLGTIDNLDKYAEFLEGKSPRNVRFENDGVKGLSLEFNDPERVNIVTFSPVLGLSRYKYLPVSAHAFSDEVSAQMLKEFSSITGFPETDVPEAIVNFYRIIEEKAVRLPVNNPMVMI